MFQHVPQSRALRDTIAQKRVVLSMSKVLLCLWCVLSDSAHVLTCCMLTRCGTLAQLALACGLSITPPPQSLAHACGPRFPVLPCLGSRGTSGGLGTT